MEFGDRRADITVVQSILTLPIDSPFRFRFRTSIFRKDAHDLLLPLTTSSSSISNLDSPRKNFLATILIAISKVSAYSLLQKPKTAYLYPTMPNLKRVLIITYYWPPSGGSGVQRWLKFAKYLPENGWQPVIYTPSNPEMPSVDESLLADIPPEAEIVTRKIFEPYSAYKRVMGMKQDAQINTGFLSEEEKPGKLEEVMRWIRGNFFIPDARKYWIKPSVRFLKKYLKDHPVDAIISTGPPHSMHLIALALRQQLGIRWVADFRDPWTNIDFYADLHLSKKADAKHRKLEKQVLSWADKVLVIGPTMQAEFNELLLHTPVQADRTNHGNKVVVIPNGFDAEDVPAGLDEKRLDPYFTIAHIGSFSPARNVPQLWKAIAAACEQDAYFKEKLRVKVVGKLDASVRKSIEEAGIADRLIQIPYLPHDEVMAEQRKSHVLLLIVNRSKNAKGILTGKIFEYLVAERPILAIGPPQGDLDYLLKEVGAGEVINWDEITPEHLLALKDAKAKGNAANYSRKVLCGEVVEML
jgi:glycosyltransferase involved in cell wall biosynthesis